MDYSILQWKAVDTGRVRAAAWSDLRVFTTGYMSEVFPATIMLVFVLIHAIYRLASLMATLT